MQFATFGVMTEAFFESEFFCIMKAISGLSASSIAKPGVVDCPIALLTVDLLHRGQRLIVAQFIDV